MMQMKREPLIKAGDILNSITQANSVKKIILI
jgi:hypothetical protein